MKKIIFLILFVIAVAVFAYADMSTQDILARVDQNMSPESRITNSTMIINGERETRTLKSKGWTQGIEKSYSVYLSPPRDKGTKMLKLNDELWTYTPSTDRTIKIAGHMLRQSLMGSDVSYEDFMEDPKLSNNYNGKITGEETINGRPCYVLYLTAKKEDIAYYYRRIWVDKDRFIPLKEELLGKSGDILKTLSINEVFQIGQRWYPKRMKFKDMMQSGNGTEIIIDSIQLDVNIPDYIFSTASMRKDS